MIVAELSTLFSNFTVCFSELCFWHCVDNLSVFGTGKKLTKTCIAHLSGLIQIANSEGERVHACKLV